MDENVNFLKRVDIFSLLCDEEINQVLSRLHYIYIDKEQVLFNEGDEGNELFIVQSGKVASYVQLPYGNKREIAEFISGDFFGEMSIFENALRSATCYTKEKSVLLSLRERDFFELILYHPDIAIKLMYRMLNITTKRLLEKSEFLSDMVQWGEEASRRAITDEVTGIYNRRFLDNALLETYDKANNRNRSFSILMVDIDDFKVINEFYDQKSVNDVLIEIVLIFKKYLRKKDIFARYGGDEFTVIMPDTDQNEAKIIAEDICKAVAGLNLKDLLDDKITQITISQGIASFPENAHDLKSLCSLADRSLYRAKQAGKNRVICAED